MSTSRPIVAIHGLGDSPEHFSELFVNAPFSTKIVLPRAPTPYGQGGSWFPIAIPVRLSAPTDLKKDVSSASSQICRFIAAQRYSRKPIVTGFSQGGILAFAAAVTCPNEIEASVPIAGFLPIPIQRPQHIPRIIAFHGESDNVIRFAHGLESIQKLRKLGVSVKMNAYPNTGHTVSDKMQSDLFATLKELL